MRAAKKKINDYLTKRLWETDPESLGAIQSLWIKFLRLLYVLLLELSDEQLAMRAMSLVYSTLLSIVPLLAVSFSVLKAFGVHTKIEIFLYYLLEPLGEKGIDLSLKVISMVENMKVSVLGSIGLALLIYTVMSQIQKVENALNYIWDVKSTRSFEKRFSNYLSVLLVGPILIFSAIGITGSLMNTSIVQQVLSIKSLGFIIYVTGKITPYIFASAAFTFIYLSLPNTRVRFSAAFTGGVFSGVVWKITGMIFTSFVVSSAKYSAIYSGFSIIILSLIWLYWSWFILLFGGKVAYYQQYKSLAFAGRDSVSLNNSAREKLVLLLMFHIGYNFYHSLSPWTIESFSRKLKLPDTIARDLITLAERKGLLVPTREDPPGYLPAKDLDVISVREILDIVRQDGEEMLAGSKFIAVPAVDTLTQRIDKAVYQAVEHETLRSLIVSAEISETDKYGAPLTQQ